MKAKYFVLSVCFIALASSLNAQNRKTKRTVGSIQSTTDWNAEIDLALHHVPKRNIGPAATSGRITAIAVPHKNLYNKPDRNTIYIGAASGGIWKSVNGGLSWAPIFDKMDVQSIGALAINPQNPD